MAHVMRRRMNKSAAWSGELALGPMSAVFVGQGGITPSHASVAHKVVLGAHHVEITGVHGTQHTFVKAGTRHKMLARDANIIMIILDARRFSEASARGLAKSLNDRPPSSLSAPDIVAGLSELPQNPLPSRINTAIDLIDQTSCVAEAATLFDLSEGQFSRLVKRHLGTPPQKWKNWLMLRRALDRIVDGCDVTSAAFEAGFADASHFSRSCYQHFGIRPSVLRNSHLQIHPSPEACRDVFETY
jgi:AraC-like DNA-binding protein